MVHFVSKLMCFVCLGSMAHAQDVEQAKKFFRSRLNKTRPVTSLVPSISPIVAQACEDDLGGQVSKIEVQAMRVYFEELPKIFGAAWVERQSWFHNMKYFAYPAAQFVDSPTVVIAGFSPPNGGASTIVNYTLGELSHQTRAEFRDVVPTGSTGGLTRRPLVLVPRPPGPGEPSNNDGELKSADLNARFANPRVSVNSAEMTDRGEALLVEVPTLPTNTNIVVVDTASLLFGDRTSEDPVLKAEAERAIVAADVLLVMLDNSNYCRPDTRQAFREIRAKYGRKKSVVVWKGVEDVDVVLRHTREFMTDGYGTDPNAMPAAVLEVYQTPESRAVVTGLEYPVLTPVLNGRSYPDLLEHIENKARDIKGYAIRDALAQIETDITDVVQKKLKEQYAARIYREGLERVIEAAGRGMQTGFPDTQKRERIQEKFFEETQYKMIRETRGFIHDTAGQIRAGALWIYRKIRKKPAPEETKHRFEIRRVELGRSIVQQALAQLKMGELRIFPNLIRTPGDDRHYDGGYLELLARNYRTFFAKPGVDLEHEWESCPTVGDRVCIELPPREDLPKNVQAALTKALGVDMEKVNTELVRRLNELEIAASDDVVDHLKKMSNSAAGDIFESDGSVRSLTNEVDRTNQDLVRIFRENLAGQRAKAFRRKDVYGIAVSGAGISTWVLAGWVFTPWNVPAIIGAFFVHNRIQASNDRARDKEFHRLVNEYFNQRQYEVTVEVLRHALAGVTDALAMSFDARAVALDNVKDALRLTTPDLNFPSDVSVPYEVLTPDGPTATKKFTARVLARVGSVIGKVTGKP